MIRPIKITLNAAHPEVPLIEATTFVGSPSAVFVSGVPATVGLWRITAVKVVAHYPDDSATTVECAKGASGVWTATLPATATSGRVTHGFEILADGTDENGDAVTGYVLGYADFAVFTRDMTIDSGGTVYYMHYFDAVPETPKKGDVAPDGSGGLQLYDGTAWVPMGGYTPPAGGIPKTDLSSGVQASLDKADTALQTAPVTSVNSKTGAVVLTGADLPVSSSDATKVDVALGNKLDKSGGVMTGNVSTNENYIFLEGSNSGAEGDRAWLAFFGLSIADVDKNKFSVFNEDGIIRYLANGGTPYQILFPTSAGTLALLSDIYTAIQQIAPDFTAKAYAKYELCSYNGVVYRCKSGYTATASSAKPPNDTTHWEAKKVSELFLPLQGGTITGEIKGKAISVFDTEGGFLELVADAVGSYFNYRNGWHGASSPIYQIYMPDASGTLALTSDIPSVAGLAPLASPAFTGTPTAPTPTASDNSTKIATTAFVKTAVDGATPNLDYVMRVNPETGEIYYTTPDTPSNN